MECTCGNCGHLIMCGPQLWDRARVDALKGGALLRERWVMLAYGASPADSLQAARELLGDNVEFSHLSQGYPIYKLAGEWF